MSNTKSSTSIDWVQKAGEHEQNARSMLKHRDALPWAVAFFAQQMTELLLKGMLVVHNNGELVRIVVRYQPMLMAIPGVVEVGHGLTPDGRDAIIVLIDHAGVTGIPPMIGGYPTITRVTGKMIPL